MARNLTAAEIEALPPTLTFGQTAALLGWDKDVVARGVRSGTFPVKAIPKGAYLVLPKQALLRMLDGADDATTTAA